AGENRGQDVRLHRILQGDGDGGTRHARRAAAHRVHDDERRAFGILQRLVDGLRRPQLPDAEPREFLTHGSDEPFVVHLLWKAHWVLACGVSRSLFTRGAKPRRRNHSSRTSARIAPCGTTRNRSCSKVISTAALRKKSA